MHCACTRKHHKQTTQMRARCFPQRDKPKLPRNKQKYFEKQPKIFFVSLQALHHSLQREVSTTRTDKDKMESGTEQTHIGESEGTKRKGEEERLFHLQRLKALFFSLAQNVEKKNEVDECFSSLKRGDQDAFYRKGCRLVQSFLKSEKLSKRDGREFLICFFIKEISSGVSEETNKAILSLLEKFLENNELKRNIHRRYSREQ